MPFKEIDVAEIYKNDEELKREEVKILMLWVEKQPHLPQVTELQMALFLHSCYYKQEASKSAIDIFFTVRTLCPELFLSRTFKDPLIKLAAEYSLVTPLPKTLPGGDLVIFVVPGPNPEHFIFASQAKLFDAVLMIKLHQIGPANGLHIVVDMKNVTFGHLIKFSAAVLSIKKFFYLLQEGLPVRMKCIHFFNVPSFMDKFLAVMKPFLKKELLDSIVLHTGVTPLFKYIPQDLLPVDYGGSCDSIQLLEEKVKLLLEENEDLLEFQDSQLVNESKRPGTSKNLNDIFGVEGSFKKLEVD